ncbi:MAG: gamma-glutamyltransferase [Pseudomonadota bacterium]|nr:gamma-glutamyltransferase [Pseudomonadota bacterium]
MANKGIVAAGHDLTLQAAALMLEEGGNAFDAIIAAHLMACVAEPVLASLGGGGFLLAYPNSRSPVIYDFFAHTPRRKRRVEELDFRPIVADFGTAQQEFHIGQGTIATPGSVRGLFRIHRDLGTLPLTVISAPAAEAARKGVTLNALQAYIFSIVSPIYTATPGASQIFESRQTPGQLMTEGEVIHQPELADVLEVLAIEGEALFYRGEIAARILVECRDGGGHLTGDDLENYDVVLREPLALNYHESRILTNPPPASGGILIAFALRLLSQYAVANYGFGRGAWLELLSDIMFQTNRARVEALTGNSTDSIIDEKRLLDPEFLDRYRSEVAGRHGAIRGTTHISVIDAEGNAASMTISNGEGCGSIVKDTGIMLNNMLGEDDLNPGGYHLWRADRRLTSMMTPTLLEIPNRGVFVTGSGGSNRIRSAVLQVLVNLIDFGMDIEAAVRAPRIHVEGDKLSAEGGFAAAELEDLMKRFPDHEIWDDLNLFFGGAHSVAHLASGYQGIGDPRRGGVCRTV